MDVAHRLDRIEEDAPAGDACTARVARLQVFHDLASAEPCWRQLQAQGAVTTPYQAHGFLSLWQQFVGQPAGVEPFIVVGFDAGAHPLFLWPLGRTTEGPFQVLRFLGGTHANFNFGLWRRDLAATIQAADLRQVLSAINRGDGPVDFLALTNQPRAWDGVANPFLALPQQASPQNSVRTELDLPAAEFLRRQLSSSMQRQLRSKERKLQEATGFRYVKADTPKLASRFLDDFFAVKAAHFEAQGIPNVFAEPGVERFLREACRHGLEDGRPLIEMHALVSDDELLALFAGTNDGQRFSSMFNTYTLGPHARYSPGIILLCRVVTDLTERGVRSFDLGAGEAGYKNMFCKDPEPLFDSFLPLTAKGWVATRGARCKYGLKRLIKQNPALWKRAQAIRRRLYGRALDAQD
jgi:CelD/BcsL family acetyltransferase involved in cellulose biosynthesis